jgi:ketosteroid isomerase-like protein
MSQENVELLRRGIEAWNRRELDVWLDLGTPDVEWMPAGPAAVERTVY